MCRDFDAWRVDNVPNSAGGGCNTSISVKGDTCTLLCEEHYVMTSGYPDYNTNVSDMFTCTVPYREWQGEATCTPRTFLITHIHVLSRSWIRFLFADFTLPHTTDWKGATFVRKLQGSARQHATYFIKSDARVILRFFIISLAKRRECPLPPISNREPPSCSRIR